MSAISAVRPGPRTIHGVRVRQVVGAAALSILMALTACATSSGEEAIGARSSGQGAVVCGPAPSAGGAMSVRCTRRPPFRSGVPRLHAPDAPRLVGPVVTSPVRKATETACALSLRPSFVKIR